MALELHSEILNCLETDMRLQQDVESWWRWRNPEMVDLAVALTDLTAKFSEFRSLLAFRLRAKGFDRSIMPKLRLANDLSIRCPDLGGGCRIQHGHSTFVFAAKIGENFHVNQNVTIGHAKGIPTIGNNVKVFTGAVVVGKITIGDNVTIAPNAFVNFDVPDGKSVFPARSVIL
jgi:serine O-acetyltransferase